MKAAIMNLSTILCSLFHRSRWHFVQRKETGPSMLTRQRHIGIYHCDMCGMRHSIIGDKLRNGDSSIPLNAPPPPRGFTMMLHRLLGGPV